MKRASFLAIFLAACGGNVVVDGPQGTGGHGGAGGTTTTTTGINTTGTSIDVSSSSASVVATSVSSGTGPNGCGALHVSSNASCQACLQSTCCAELLACDRGTVCGELIQCLVNCAMNDPSCDNACTMKFAGGMAGVQAVGHCINQCMASGCNQPATAVCDSGLVADTSDCDTCLTLECCPEAEACTGGGCQMCLAANAPPSCGVPAYVALGACKVARCPGACP
jgi:hypothetical protein